MKLKFKCRCGKGLAADVAAAGKKAKCPNCGEAVTVPQAVVEAKPTASPAAAKLADNDDLHFADEDDFKPPAPAAKVNPPRPASPPKPVAPKAKNPAASPLLPMASSPLVPLANSPLVPLDDTEAILLDDLPLEPASASPLVPLDEFNDDTEYALRPEPEKPCPQCGMMLSAQEAVCARCGYNRRTGMAQPLAVGPSLEERISKRTAESPNYRRSGGGGSMLKAQLLRFGIGGVVVGVGLLVAGIREYRLNSAASASPESITLAELIRRGPDGNPNIVLTDFQLCNNFVYEHQHGFDAWTAVWAPVVVRKPGTSPQTVANAIGTNLQAIIYAKRIYSKEQFVRTLGVEQLRGMVINRIQSLPEKDKVLLEDSYPNIDVDKCIIFEEGRVPQNAEQSSLKANGGSALIFIGLCLCAAAFWVE
ncbi:MAG TPA: hypothetical protein VGJ15_10730 [Pirellulales bacterium]|jgi:hypothetical protein